MDPMCASSKVCIAVKPCAFALVCCGQKQEGAYLSVHVVPVLLTLRFAGPVLTHPAVCAQLKILTLF